MAEGPITTFLIREKIEKGGKNEAECDCEEKSSERKEQEEKRNVRENDQRRKRVRSECLKNVEAGDSRERERKIVKRRGYIAREF